MWMIVDEMVLNILLGLSVAFFACLAFFIFLLWKSPKAVRTIISAWFSHKVLTLEVTLDGVMKAVARKRGADGSLEAKIDGRTSVKVIPNNPSPGLATPAHLEGSGVKVFLAADSKAIAVTPSLLLAAEVSERASEPESIPENVLAWAKEQNIGAEKLVSLTHEKGRKAKGKENEPKPEKLFVLHPSKLIKYFETVWDEGAFRNRIENERLNTLRGRGFGGNKMLLLIGIVFVVVAIIVVVIMSSGSQVKVPGLGI